MPAWRCTKCDINYPTTHYARGAQACDACGRDTDYFTNSVPHKDWEYRVVEQLGGEDAEESAPWTFHPENDSAPVIYRNDFDRVEVTDHTLRKMGYSPVPFMIVKLNGKYYELLDYNAQHMTWTVEVVHDNAGFKGQFKKTLRQIRRLPVYREDKNEVDTILWELPDDSETETSDS